MEKKDLKYYLDELHKIKSNQDQHYSKDNVNTLIGLVIFGLVVWMVIFGYFLPIKWLLFTGFLIGLFLLCVLIVAKNIWFPSNLDDGKDVKKNNEKPKPSDKKSESLTSVLGLDQLDLPSSDDYNKNLEKAFG